MAKNNSSSDEDHSKENFNANGHLHDWKVTLDTCKRIAYATQFIVITCSLAAFMVVVWVCINKLRHRHVLESKDSLSMNEAWFKYAICLRPFITPSLMNLFYQHHKRYKDISNYTGYLETLHGVAWRPTSWLDDTLRPDDFRTYFKLVHPWNKVKPRELWDFRFVYFQRAFQEFKINKKKMPQRQFPGITADNDAIDSGYTILKNKMKGNTSKTAPMYMLLGDYNFSPLYAGCLNITVNEFMNKRQMEINIKFRDQIDDDTIEITQSAAKDTPKISLFEAADLFVYDANENFSELPVIHKFTKYSIRAHSLERLFVKGSRYYRSDTSTDCTNSPTYSQTNCRYWCIMRSLFDAISCTLPWMRSVLRKPWIARKHKELKPCDNPADFIETLNKQREYLHPKGNNKTKPVQECLNNCRDECNSYKVQLLSLGSKSIGSNYGISLTVSPEVDTVSTHFDYQVLTMVAELSASISFLLGLSAIAIYDWVIAFAVWAAVRLKLYSPPEEEEDEEEDDGSDSEASLAALRAAGVVDSDGNLINPQDGGKRAKSNKVAPKIAVDTA